MLKSLLIIAVALLSSAISAAPLSYDLKPQKIAKGTWLLQGKTEDFSQKNGGNIVNTAFIVTDAGVVVIDTGPSLRYGREMRKAIAKVTSKPIHTVFNTHHHPDHFLGNQAFTDSKIISLAETGKQIKLHGNSFAENMYRMTGDWMRSTEALPPTSTIESDELKLPGHHLQLSKFSGHSGADLVVFDKTTGILFASDMIFYQRALTTPHSPGIDVWLDELEEIRTFPYTRLVPGHGPVVNDQRAIDQMHDYLTWLDKTLRESAERGLSMVEVIKQPIPKRFNSIALKRSEFARTVAHLYSKYEEQAF